MVGAGDSGLPDAELLRRHAGGDREAFGLLFARHRDRLWAVALRTLGDPDEAADALQEGMISAFRRAGSFRGDSAVTTWLHRIVVNACLDRVRRRSARPAVPAGDERSLDLLARGGTHASDPAADRDTVLDVDAALRLLPYDQRTALVLVDMLGYPVQLAAETLNVSVGTIKSRCARGRARLVPHLSHLRGADPKQPAAPAPGATPRGSAEGNRPAPGNVSSSREDSRTDQFGNDADPVGQPAEGGGDRR